QGASALAAAAGKGSLESVRQLLAAMASDAVRGTDADGNSALDAAATGGDARIVRLLLAQGLPATESGLRTAVAQGHLQAARLLHRAMGPSHWPTLEADAPVEARVYTLILQQKPQEALAAYRAFEVVACGRMTPLASAVNADNAEAVRALLALGVDVNYQTPAPLRSELVPQPHTSSGLPRLVHVLPPPCNDAPLTPRAGVATALQATPPVGALPNTTAGVLPSAGFWSDSALMRAVERGNLEIARLLVAAGADPTLRSNYPPHASAQAWLKARPPSRGGSLAAWKALLKL
ncbi:MAG: ankyrin repeat domain-containing protein, partial [Variovorax sp.]|nr:ankyrin repeat domain-containing protein [Variovorax sp.]